MYVSGQSNQILKLQKQTQTQTKKMSERFNMQLLKYFQSWHYVFWNFNMRPLKTLKILKMYNRKLSDESNSICNIFRNS